MCFTIFIFYYPAMNLFNIIDIIDNHKVYFIYKKKTSTSIYKCTSNLQLFLIKIKLKCMIFSSNFKIFTINKSIKS